jgi:hypothetical protein
MTTDAGSSLSQAEVHDSVKRSIVRADAHLIQASFEAGPVRWLTDWNFAGAAYPRVTRQTDPEPDTKSAADTDRILIDMGQRLTRAHLVKTYGDRFEWPTDIENETAGLSPAQSQSLAGIVQQAVRDKWSGGLLRAMLAETFPDLGGADSIAAELEKLVAGPADPAVGGGAPPPAPEALAETNQAIQAAIAAFAEAEWGEGPIEFAGGKKCTKGLSCGNSCIAATKTCKKSLTPEQAAQHKALIGKVMGNVMGPAPAALSSADRLLDALDSRDYDAALAIADQVEAAARQRAVDAVTDRPKYYGRYAGEEDQLFEEGIEPGNGTPDDWILNELYSARGYDGPPQVADAATIDAEIATGAIDFYRGFGSSKESFAGHFEALKNGQYYAGHGIYGHDTYSALVRGGDQSSRESAIDIAESYGLNGGVVRGVLKDVRMIDQSALQKEMTRDLKNLQSWALNRRDEIDFGTDPSIFYQDIAATIRELDNEFPGVNVTKDNKIILTRSDGTEQEFAGFDVEEDDDMWASLMGTETQWTVKGIRGQSFDTKQEAIAAAAAACKSQIALERARKKYNGDAAAAERFQQQANTLYKVAFGDAAPYDLFDDEPIRTKFEGKASGRYATIKGYDAVYLDKAYSPHYALTLNRTKYLLQETEFT